MRQHVCNPHPALPVLRELEGAAHQGPGALRILDFAGDLVEIRAAVVLVQLRLGIEQVHLTGAAVHEQVDHTAGFGRNMRRSGHEIGRKLRD